MTDIYNKVPEYAFSKICSKVFQALIDYIIHALNDSIKSKFKKLDLDSKILYKSQILSDLDSLSNDVFANEIKKVDRDLIINSIQDDLKLILSYD